MSAPQVIIPILEQLSLAYPEKRLEAATLQVYLEHLDDIPPYLLEAAVRAHIQASGWFPRIAELRSLAARLAGTNQFDTLPERPVDRMLLEAQALEDAFYHEGLLDPAEWRALSAKFERCGRHFRAEYTLEKLSRLACNFSGGCPAPTQPATAPIEAPTQAATQAPEPTPASGKPITVGRLSFVIPEGLASEISSNTTTELELPFINGPADLPQHTVLTLNDYRVQGAVMQPRIVVFRAAEYAGYAELTANILAALQGRYTDGQPLPAALKGQLKAQIHGLAFQNGHGIRLLEQYDQAPLPVNNHELFYLFRGVTNDGQFFVQAVLPVQTPFLPADGQPDTAGPAQGVPFDMNDMPGYLARVVQKLNDSPGEAFTPSLEPLDVLIELITVTGL